MAGSAALRGHEETFAMSSMQAANLATAPYDDAGRGAE